MDDYTFPNEFLLEGSGVSPNANSGVKTTAHVTDKDDDHESDGSELGDTNGSENVGKSVLDHYMTTDSYGKLRWCPLPRQLRGIKLTQEQICRRNQ